MIYPNKPLYLPSLLGYVYYLTYYTLTTKDNMCPPFLCCRSPRKNFRRWHAPRSFGTFCPEVARCGASPAGVFLFGRSFIFQGAAHR